MSKTARKQQSFGYGATILLCSTVLVKIIGAVFKIPLASDSCLGDLGFGYFSSAYDLFTPVYSLAMGGLPIAVARVVAVYSSQQRYNDVRNTLHITKRIYFVTGLGAFVLMLALIYPFTRITDPTGETVYSLLALAPSLLFCCVMSTYRGYYEGMRNMYPTAVSDVIEALGKLILGFGFAFAVIKLTGNAAYGAAAAMLGITAGTAVSALYLRLRHTGKGDGITPEELSLSPPAGNTGAAARTLIAIAIPVVLASLANNIATLVDVSMVKWQLSGLIDGQADLIREMYAGSVAGYNSNAASALTDAQIPTFLYGIRGKAITLYNLVPTFTTVIGVSALPVLASVWVTGKKPLIKSGIESMFRITSLITLPAGIGLIALSGSVMGLLYGSEASVEIGGPLLAVFGCAAIFAGIAIPMTSMLQAVGKQIPALINIALGAVIKIAVNYFTVGIPEINIRGAAYGTLACYFFIFAANLFTLIRTTKIIPDFGKVFLKPVFAAICCGASAYLFSRLGESGIITVLAIFAGVAVYFAVLVILNTFKESDILSLPNGERILKICVKYRIIR